MVTKSYTEARAHLAELLDQVTQDREPVLITRRGGETVALIAADELDALLETVHL
ncbi:MAG TPA: type II toxin-antitoxin system Phd/YefM family antitoxin [Nitrolancea sp.]|nr:type II toxin-antitoxin system Phd/YefM family antitoxin [Nitrolancea sp.]